MSPDSTLEFYKALQWSGVNPRSTLDISGLQRGIGFLESYMAHEKPITSDILRTLEDPDTNPSDFLRNRVRQARYAAMSDEDLSREAQRAKYDFFLLQNLRNRKLLSEQEILDSYLIPVMKNGRPSAGEGRRLLDYIFSIRIHEVRENALRTAKSLHIATQRDIEIREEFFAGRITLSDLRKDDAPCNTGAESAVSTLKENGFTDFLSASTLCNVTAKQQAFYMDRAIYSVFCYSLLRPIRYCGIDTLSDSLISEAIGAMCWYSLNEHHLDIGAGSANSPLSQQLRSSACSKSQERFFHSLEKLLGQLEESAIVLASSHRGADNIISLILQSYGIRFLNISGTHLLYNRRGAPENSLMPSITPLKQVTERIKKATANKHIILCQTDQWFGKSFTIRTHCGFPFQINSDAFQLARSLRCPLWFAMVRHNIKKGGFSITLRESISPRNDLKKQAIDYSIAIKQNILTTEMLE